MFDSSFLFYFYISVLTLLIIGGSGLYLSSRFKKEKRITSALGFVLYEVAFSGEEKKNEGKPFKELIAVMEQFYSGMSALGEKKLFSFKRDNFVLEIALPHVGEETVFFVAVPKQSARIFEKQLEGLYPSARVQLKAEDYNIFNPDGHSVVSVLKTDEHPALPIRTYDRLESDPLEVILNSFSKLKKVGEGAALQIVLRPARWQDRDKIEKARNALKEGRPPTSASSGGLASVFKAVDAVISGPKSKKSEEAKPPKINEDSARLIDDKISRPLFNANIRLVASASGKEEAVSILKELESAFLQFAEPQGNHFSFWHPVGRALERSIYNFSFRLFDEKSALLLTIKELTSIFHFPSASVSAPKLKTLGAKSAPAPAELPSLGLMLGKNVFRGEEAEIRMADEDRCRHLYVIGQTGTGKTEFLKNLIRQDIENGKGLAVIDPHGDMVSDILGLVPDGRIDDVIYFDPGNVKRPMGLNFLEYDQQYPEQKTFVVEELMQIFIKLYGSVPESIGPIFQQYFRNATHLVIEDPASGSTLLDIIRVMADKNYREYKISRSKNPVVNSFWKEVAEKTGGEHSLANLVPYITSKFDTFLSNEIMRPIIAQEHSAFNMREVMDSGKILLVNLSKGRLGELNSSLLGLVIVGKILMASFSRADQPGESRRDFYLYMDEFHNFTTPSIATILSEARKYRLSLTMAHQFIGQLTDEIRKAVFGNVGTLVSFRIGREDTEVLEKQFEPVFSGYDLMNIENYHAAVKMLLHGKTVKPFDIITMPPPTGSAVNAEQIKEISSLKYGVPRETVEAEIAKRYQA